MKYCYKCKLSKELIEFSKCAKRKDGLQSMCKSCNKAYLSLKFKTCPKYREAVKEAYKRYSKTEKSKEKSKRNHKNNKLKELEYGRKYYLDNKEKRILNHSVWVEKNRDKVRSYAKKRLSDPYHNFSARIRLSLRSCIRNGLKVKTSKTFDLLGYNVQNLYEHLNKYMNKPCEVCNQINIELSTSHIDHIKPICTGKTLDDLIELNQLINLRLICAKCNLEKSGKYE